MPRVLVWSGSKNTGEPRGFHNRRISFPSLADLCLLFPLCGAGRDERAEPCLIRRSEARLGFRARWFGHAHASGTRISS